MTLEPISRGDPFVESNENTALAVPQYDDGELSESDMDELLAETEPGKAPVVIVDGELGMITEED